ncbi:hypothetical protein [Rhodococcus sp. X156]|uniref:hypothetical protein n=1 Tax=Rhodococcus sp. X156 TaxID=2499145 RepID=UPI000FD9868B|nr:hypothetical protein [Rhodococcus sp. X156]
MSSHPFPAANDHQPLPAQWRPEPVQAVLARKERQAVVAILLMVLVLPLCAVAVELFGTVLNEAVVYTEPGSPEEAAAASAGRWLWAVALPTFVLWVIALAQAFNALSRPGPRHDQPRPGNRYLAITAIVLGFAFLPAWTVLRFAIAVVAASS